MNYERINLKQHQNSQKMLVESSIVLLQSLWNSEVWRKERRIAYTILEVKLIGWIVIETVEAEGCHGCGLPDRWVELLSRQPLRIEYRGRDVRRSSNLNGSTKLTHWKTELNIGRNAFDQHSNDEEVATTYVKSIKTGIRQLHRN